ncbi:MAG: ABC transporter permease [Planctomycetes bacterium]|nr:ABC transporter permease [Planctomycetota bacterium]
MLFVLKNILRRKFRTVFSVLGVGIGISIMVALFTISDDMIGQMTMALGTQRGDIVVSQAASDDLDSDLPVRHAAEVRAIAGVQRAAPTIFSFLRTQKGFSGQPAILYYGLVEDSPMNDAMTMVEGEKISDKDTMGVVFGQRCWELVNQRLGNRRYKVGDDLQLSDLITSPGIADLFGVPPNWDKMDEMAKLRYAQTKLMKELGIAQQALLLNGLRVRGVCKTGIAFQDTAVFFHLEIAQLLKDKNEDRDKDGKLIREATCNWILVDAADGVDLDQLAASITEKVDKVRATRSEKVMGRYQEIEMFEKFGWIISLIAALAGALGVLNTMTLAVYERTREIGLMLAVGWPRLRIIWLTIVEGLLIAVMGGIVGVAFGFGEVQLARNYFHLEGLSATLNVNRSLQALGLAFIIGFFASIYPAWRASRLAPIDALRQE